MADRAPAAARATRAHARRLALSQSVLTIAAAATTSAALIWTALFYNAATQHSAASTPTASATDATPQPERHRGRPRSRP